MFKQGDIIEITDDAPYSATKPGTKWMVYSIFYDGKVRIGTLPINDHSKEDMIRLYGGTDSRTIGRKYESGVKVFTVEQEFIKLSGNNAIFKDKLLQGDIWEEEKPKFKKLRPRTIIADDEDWLTWTPW